MSGVYTVPISYLCPLHHVRPRFKNDREGVLLFFADAVTHTDKADKTEFDKELDRLLRGYPGNAIKSDKTIANWRTEIAALFTLIMHNGNMEFPSLRCEELSDKRDLPEAFRKFLFSFQYPGGHLKPEYAAQLISEGVKFKPAKTILNVLEQGNKNGGNSFCITKAEACHCIFNDLRVTRDHEDAETTLTRILENRKLGLSYVDAGDVIRYAGDILDYMEIAGLVKTHDGKHYYRNALASDLKVPFLFSDEWFTGYDNLYGRKNLDAEAVRQSQASWEKYVNRDLRGHFDKIVEDAIQMVGEGAASPSVLTPGHIETQCGNTTTGDIGEHGEALVFGHECMRLKNDGREDLVHLVKRIPTALALGYDISSIESDTEQRRFIEVKSTTSFKSISFNSVHLTPNEWRTAETEREKYYVYRLFVSVGKGEAKLFTLQDPVGKYKADQVSIVPTSAGGIDIRFDSGKVGCFEELLTWKS
jgi:hypothetical protein